MKRQVARIQTIAVTEAGTEPLLDFLYKVRTKSHTAAFPKSGSGLETALAR